MTPLRWLAVGCAVIALAFAVLDANAAATYVLLSLGGGLLALDWWLARIEGR